MGIFLAFAIGSLSAWSADSTTKAFKNLTNCTEALYGYANTGEFAFAVAEASPQRTSANFYFSSEAQTYLRIVDHEKAPAVELLTSEAMGFMMLSPKFQGNASVMAKTIPGQKKPFQLFINEEIKTFKSREIKGKHHLRIGPKQIKDLKKPITSQMLQPYIDATRQWIGRIDPNASMGDTKSIVELLKLCSKIDDKEVQKTIADLLNRFAPKPGQPN